MSVQRPEKKSVSPRIVVVAMGLAGAGTAVAIWALIRGAEVAPTPTPPAVTSAAPPSVASLPVAPLPVPAQLASGDLERRTRLKAATMGLPRGPLLGPRAATGPLDQSRGGQVARAGRLFRLDVDPPALGDAQLVCLDAPESDLGGVQATCKPLKGWPGRAMCARADAAQGVELKGAISWRLPCP